MKHRLNWSALLCSTLIAAGGCGPAAVPGEAGAQAPSGRQANAAAVPATMSYRELCEASAAVVLDDSHFAVASDDSETIAIYRRGRPAPDHTVSHAGVTDIEGAARIGNRVFWLTSHSLTRNGSDNKPERKVLFTMSVAARPTLAETGGSFTGLRGRIASALGIGEPELTPWLNIEGLAATTEGDLLLGLRRAPEGDARAYVVRMASPFAPAAAAAAAPARIWRLDLGGRGIRSIEQVGTGAHAYLILAGPRADEAIPFALYWWDGRGETVSPGPVVAFGDMAPEALIAWPDGELQFLGDNESQCSDKEGDPQSRHFPSLSLRPSGGE